MAIVYDDQTLDEYMRVASDASPEKPILIDKFLERAAELDVDALADETAVVIAGIQEHIEEAGIHSGDSSSVLPAQKIPLEHLETIQHYTTLLANALKVKGLMNIQFAIQDDRVYVIEVNPRASRTVPFMSKVTGVPMVDLAVRIALGETLREMGWAGGLLPPPPFVAVKAPAFSTAKLRGVDPSVGPGMQSTGEVIGIHEDPRVALAKALLGAALVPPRAGPEGALALLTIADRDKPLLARLATGLARAGYRFAATAGTAAALAALGHDARPVAKYGALEGSEAVAIMDLIESGEVRLVVNTPTPQSGAVRDAAEIRLAATAEGILCLTAIETAVAAAEALDPAVVDRLAEVRSLGEWVPGAPVPV
jgi:carbamoyl-phosphate synthase large subunit